MHVASMHTAVSVPMRQFAEKRCGRIKALGKSKPVRSTSIGCVAFHPRRIRSKVSSRQIIAVPATGTKRGSHNLYSRDVVTDLIVQVKQHEAM